MTCRFKRQASNESPPPGCSRSKPLAGSGAGVSSVLNGSTSIHLHERAREEFASRALSRTYRSIREPGASSSIMLSWSLSANSAALSSSSAGCSPLSAPFSTSAASSRSASENSPATSSTAANTPRFISRSSLASFSASAFLSFSGSSPISAANHARFSPRAPLT